MRAHTEQPQMLFLGRSKVLLRLLLRFSCHQFINPFAYSPLHSSNVSIFARNEHTRKAPQRYIRWGVRQLVGHWKYFKKHHEFLRRRPLAFASSRWKGCFHKYIKKRQFEKAVSKQSQFEKAVLKRPFSNKGSLKKPFWKGSFQTNAVWKGRFQTEAVWKVHKYLKKHHKGRFHKYRKKASWILRRRPLAPSHAIGLCVVSLGRFHKARHVYHTPIYLISRKFLAIF